MCRLTTLLVGTLAVCSVVGPLAPLSGQEMASTRACYSSQVLLVTALPDTVSVDDGVPFEVLGTVRHGQSFLLNKATQPVPSDTVVLVRWSPSPDSPPHTPRASTQWVDPGQQRVVIGAPRAPDHWAEHPTFDVRWGGFPDENDFDQRAAAKRDQLMTPEEFFAFCSLEVDLDVVRRGDWTTPIGPMEWARESNGAWAEYPASIYLSSWAHDIERSRVLSLPPDVGGTWLVTAILPSGREYRFLLRTGDHVGGYWTQDPPPSQPTPPPWEFRALGYQMHIWLAMDQVDLPEVVGDDARLPCRRYGPRLAGEKPHEEDPSCLATISTWYVGFPDPLSASRIGRFPAETIYELFSDDAELEGLFGPEGLSRMALRERLDTGDLSRPPDGRFDETVPSLRFEQDLIIYRDTTVQLTAVRISTDAVVVAKRRQ